MKKVFFILLIALVAIGCKTAKQTSKETQHATSLQNLDVKQTNDSVLNKTKTAAIKLTIDSSKLVVDKGTRVKITVEESETTNLSVPDSTGKQYPTSTTKLKKVITECENKNLQVNQNVETQHATSLRETDKSDYKSELSVKDQGKTDTSNKSQLATTEETETPVWVYGSVFILLFGMLGLVYLVLKRFNVVK